MAASYRPYRRIGGVLLVILLALSCAEFARNAIEPTSVDFLSFWGAARLAIAGHPALAYDGTAIHQVQAQVAAFSNGEMPFPYLPAFILLVLPFALLPFPAAMIAWTLATFAAFAIAVRKYAPASGWLLLSFPPVLAVSAIGQNGFITAALFVGGLALMRRGRPFAAGLALGCLVLKPQLALMLPVAMLAGREWRAVAGAMLSSALVVLVGVLAFGPDAYRAWFAQLPLYVDIARNGLVGWHKLVSVYAFGRQAGLTEDAAFALHGAVAAVAVALVARGWRSDAGFGEKAAVLSAATMLASPYVYLYDALVLLPAFVWLVERDTPPAIVGTLWLSPALVLLQTAAGAPVNFGPLLPLVLLAMVAVSRRAPAVHRYASISAPT